MNNQHNLNRWMLSPSDHGRGFAAFAAGCLHNSLLRVRGRSWRFGVFDGAGFCGEIGIGSLGRESRGCHASCWIDIDRSGGRYGAETLAMVCGFAFGSLGLHRVVAEVLPDNAASLNVAARVGFRHEGTALRMFFRGGRWQDYEVLSLTTEDWPTPGAQELLGTTSA